MPCTAPGYRSRLHVLSWCCLPGWCACLPVGVELMLLILKSKRAARTAALKCLDFATTGCPAACDRLVDQQGLKTLFAIFMGKLKVSGGGGRPQWATRGTPPAFTRKVLAVFPVEGWVRLDKCKMYVVGGAWALIYYCYRQ